VVFVFCGLGLVVLTTMRGGDQQLPISQVTPTATPIPSATPIPTWTPTPSPTKTPRPTYTPAPTPVPFDESNLEESYCRIVQNDVAHHKPTDLYCQIEETLPTGRVRLVVDITFSYRAITHSEMIDLQMRLHKRLFASPVAPGAVDTFTRWDIPLPDQVRCTCGSGIGYKTQADYDWEPFDSQARNALWYQLRDLNQYQDSPGQDQEYLGYANPPSGTCSY